MKQNRVPFICVLAIVILGGGLALFRSRHSASIVTECQPRLDSSLPSSTLPEDARRWLDSNSFQVVQWNPHGSNGFILHIVEKNQDLMSIALMYGVEMGKLREVNGLKGTELKPGQTIKIPSDVRYALPWNRETVQALGRTKSETAVQTLRNAFIEHLSDTNEATDPYMDAEVLLALRVINSEQADGVIRNIVHDIRQRGPRISWKPWLDKRYTAAMEIGIMLLGETTNQFDDAELEGIQSDRSVVDVLRSHAFYWIMIKEMRDNKKVLPSSRVDWAYERYMAEGGKTIEAYKDTAISMVFYAMGVTGLPALREKIAILEAREGPKIWGVLWLRHIAMNLETGTKVSLPKPTWRGPSTVDGVARGVY